MQAGSISSATRITGLTKGCNVTLAALVATVTYGFFPSAATSPNLTAANGFPVTTGTPVTIPITETGLDLWAISATGTASVLVQARS